MRGRRVAMVAVGLAAIALAAGCGSDDEPDPSLGEVERSPQTEIVIPPGQPIVVGVSSALTGPVGERGSEYRDAVVLGVRRFEAANGEAIEGHPIEVHAEDDGCTVADQTVVAAERLLSRPALVGVLGPQCSTGAEAVLDRYEDAGVVVISGSATATALTAGRAPGGFFFRTAFRNDLQGTVVGDFVADDLKARRVLLVDDDEIYGTDLAAATTAVLERNGVVVTRVSAPQGTVDFSEIADRVARDPPDAVGYAGFNPDAALLLRQLRDAEFEGTFGSFDAAASVTEFVQPLGAIAEGTLFAGCSLPLPGPFRAEFATLHGTPPAAAFNGQYADATQALLEAVAATAEPQPDGALTIDPRQLRDAVAATNIADGVTGRIRFDERGDRRAGGSDAAAIAEGVGLIGCQVRNGRLVALEAGE